MRLRNYVAPILYLRELRKELVRAVLQICVVVLMIQLNCCSGDQDSVVPFFGSRSLINGLAKQLGLKSTVPYRAWFEGKQVTLLHIHIT